MTDLYEHYSKKVITDSALQNIISELYLITVECFENLIDFFRIFLTLQLFFIF